MVCYVETSEKDLTKTIKTLNLSTTADFVVEIRTEHVHGCAYCTVKKCLSQSTEKLILFFRLRQQIASS